MIRRNLIVVYRPVKSNSVILSEPNHRLMNLTDIGNSCLNITNNRTDHYCSWLPYGGQQIRDTEIGINQSVAEAIGLYEGCIVSCRLIDDVPVLDVVDVTATTEKDWEMLEATSYRIQTTLLDQTKIVNEGQKLIIWINKALSLTVKIEKLTPNVSYGKIENNTEFIVTPFKNLSSDANDNNKNVGDKPKTQSNGVKENIVKEKKDTKKRVEENKENKKNNENKKNGQNGSLYDRLFNKSRVEKEPPRQPSLDENVIDSTTLDNVSVVSSTKYQSIDTPSDSESDSDSDSSDSNSSVSRSSTVTPMPKPKHSPTVRLDVQIRLFEALLNELKSQERKTFTFRVVSRPWDDSTQMCNLFITEHNIPEGFDAKQVYVMRCESINESDERVMREFYVNIVVVPDTEATPNNIYPTIEMNDILMAHLNVRKFSRVTLATKKTVMNFCERIDIIPAIQSNINDIKEIEEGFKRLLANRSRFNAILMNQDQIFKVCDGDAIVKVKIIPESFRYCLCDGDILRESKIFVDEEGKDLGAVFTAAEEITNPKLKEKKEGETVAEKTVPLDPFENIVNDCVQNVIKNSCLDSENAMRKMFNIIITGAETTGKSKICNEILEQLEFKPFNCYTETYFCAQNKGRKTESISKDLRQILSRCMEQAPAVLLLDNLDMLAHSVIEHSHDNEYYNRVSDVIQHLIMEYTEVNSITVIATITSKNNLNQRLYTSRGKHLFQKIYKLPELEKDDRKKIIQELCESAQIKLDKLNFEKFANLTEGYTVGYLQQFVERAIFYAHRNDNNNPVVTNEVLLNSMKTTNAYCLQGIENNIKLDEYGEDEDESCGNLVEKLPGLESVVSVFEEILIWPTRYPQIFEHSPLRNQAGILLYGAPGTGKTFLVSQVSRIWNLRMISVKGPELLAKFIGQSEENVRNLFDRARSAKPCVLFFDEFDSLAPRRGHDSTGVTDRVVNQLLTELDGVEGLQGVVVIAATSRPELLDPALLRSGRIDRLVQCSLPNRSARLKIFESLAKTSSLKLDKSVDFKYFCDEKSDNYTGADIKSVLVSANMIAVKECLAKCGENVPNEIHITQKHLVEAFINTRPSLAPQDIQKYQQTYQRFMNKENPTKNFVAQRATLA